jgi:hypothetical protein
MKQERDVANCYLETSCLKTVILKYTVSSNLRASSNLVYYKCNIQHDLFIVSD